MRTSFVVLLNLCVVAALHAGGDGPQPGDVASFKAFEEKFLALVRDPGEKSLQAAADVDRMRANAVAFLKSIHAEAPIKHDRFVEQWLVSLEPICDENWKTAAVVSTLSTKEGVSKVRLRLRSADADQIECLVWLVLWNGERRFVDLQRLPEGASAALQTHLALGGESLGALADQYRASELGARSDPRPSLFRIKELAADPVRRFRDRLYFVWAGETGRSKQCLRRALELKHDFDDDPAVAWLIAKSHYHLEQSRDAVRSLEWYESLVGKDSWSRLLRAKLHKQDGRFADARQELAEALKQDPRSTEAFADLFEVTSPKEKKNAADRLPSGGAFDAIAWTLGATLSSLNDTAGLEAILKHAETHNGSREVTAYLKGEWLLTQGKAKEAVEVLIEHLPESDDEPEDADDILDLFCDAMHRQGKALEAYRRAASTPKKAFLSIADKLVGEDGAAVFERIGSEHFERHPDDGAAVEWFATSLVGRREFSKASRAVDRFLARPDAKDSEDFDSLRALRVRIFLSERRLADALTFIGDDEDLFNVAAEELANAKRTDELSKLLDEFSRHLDDPILFANWKAEVAFLKKDYRLSAAFFRSLTHPMEKPKDAELDDRRRIMFLRVLLRLGFKAGIDRVAENILFPDDELGFALAYAAVGNVEKLKAALEDCLEVGLEATDVLSDPDLGPLLDTPALAKVRDKVLLDPVLNL